MTVKTQSLKPFSVWAKEVQEEHPEIIEHWSKSEDPYMRAKAQMIKEAVGCGAL